MKRASKRLKERRAPSRLRELAEPFSADLHARLNRCAIEARRATYGVFADDLSETAKLLDPLNLNSLRLLRDRLRRHVVQARATSMSGIRNRLGVSLDQASALVELQQSAPMTIETGS